jgi:hypothetical protein
VRKLPGYLKLKVGSNKHKLEFQFFSDNEGMNYWGKSERIPLLLTDEGKDKSVDINKQGRGSGSQSKQENNYEAMKEIMLRKLIKARKTQAILKYKIKLFEDKLHKVEGEEAQKIKTTVQKFKKQIDNKLK